MKIIGYKITFWMRLLYLWFHSMTPEPWVVLQDCEVADPNIRMHRSKQTMLLLSTEITVTIDTWLVSIIQEFIWYFIVETRRKQNSTLCILYFRIYKTKYYPHWQNFSETKQIFFQKWIPCLIFDQLVFYLHVMFAFESEENKNTSYVPTNIEVI